MKIIKKLGGVLTNLARNGFNQTLRLFYIYLVAPIYIMWLNSYLVLYTKINRIKGRYIAGREIEYLKRNFVLAIHENGINTRIEDLGLTPENLSLLRRELDLKKEVVIAEIDQDGFLLSNYGTITGSKTVSEENYLSRNRFDLKVVATDGYVGVKKCFKSDKSAFINELRALDNLGESACNVPTLMEVDFSNLSLVFSFILGNVLRLELAERGALLLDRDANADSKFDNLGQIEKWQYRIKEGKRYLFDVIDNQFVENLFNELRKIHSSGFVLNDIKYGNIIVEKTSNKPYFIDFDYAENINSFNTTSQRILRDRDIELFNLHFDTEKLTFKRIQKRIRSKLSKDYVYAPVYFGSGLHVGGIWTVEVGFGRWHYILKNNLPSLKGKRILDLGANNSHNSLQMLRSGASEVIGIEMDSKFIDQGKFLKESFEWTDNKEYNFMYIQANMKDVPTMELGKFDIVVALCSIYYLDDEDISRVAQYLSRITDTFVLQCNIASNLDRTDSHTYKKASIDYAVNILKENGFNETKVIAPYKYSRPLVIGKKGS